MHWCKPSISIVWSEEKMSETARNKVLQHTAAGKIKARKRRLDAPPGRGILLAFPSGCMHGIKACMGEKRRVDGDLSG